MAVTNLADERSALQIRIGVKSEVSEVGRVCLEYGSLRFGSWVRMPRPPLHLLQLTSLQPYLSFDPDQPPQVYSGILAYLPGPRCDRLPRGSMHHCIAHDPYISVELIEVFHIRDHWI